MLQIARTLEKPMIDFPPAGGERRMSMKGKNRGKHFWLFAGLVLAMLAGYSFVSGNWNLTASLAAQESAGTLRVDVDLVTVEVVVLDKKGKPVSGLKKENFQLLDDGKPQAIATFDAIVESAENQAMPTSLKDVDEESRRGKVILILFDDSHISSSQIKFARDAAEKYVQQHMRPWDQFGVAVYGQSLRIIQNFTNDANKVLEAIKKPATSFSPMDKRMQSQTGGDLLSGQRQRRPGQESRSPMEMQEMKFQTQNLFATLRALSGSMSMVKGRKSILLFSEDFSMPADAQNEFQALVDAARKANVSFFTLDARGINSTMGQIRRPGPDVLQGKASPESMLSAGLSRLGTLAANLFPGTNLLSTSGSFLALAMPQQGGGGQGGGSSGGTSAGGGSSSGGGGTASGGGSAGGGTAGGSTAGGSTTGTSGTTGNTTTTTNTNTTTNTRTNTTDTLGRGNTGLDSLGSEMASFDQQTLTGNILRSLASETNGLAVFNTNDLNERLNDVDLELSNFYVLGYLPTTVKRDGKMHKLDIKTNVKDVNLKYRKNYQDPRPPEISQGSKAEKSLSAAIASPVPVTQLPITFRTVYFYDSPQLARVPIFTKIQRGTIELKKKGDSLVALFDIMGVAYNEDGSIAARFSESIQRNLSKEAAEQFKASDITYRSNLKLRPGKYRLKVAVADEKGKAGSAEQNIEIPAIPATGWVTSTLVLSQDFSRLPDLIQNLQTRLLDEADPMIFRGFQIRPPLEVKINRQSNLIVFYKVYNLKDTAPNPNLVAKVQLLDESGKNQEGPTIPLENLAQMTNKGELAIGFMLPVKDYQPGKYKLVVETVDPVANLTVKSEAEMTLL
jgi:VWFA-related protein